LSFIPMLWAESIIDSAFALQLNSPPRNKTKVGGEK
jgi:hypothetical protein